MVRALVYIIAATWVMASAASNIVKSKGPDKTREAPLITYIIERSHDNGNTWTHRGTAELRTINIHTPRLVFAAAAATDNDLIKDVNREQVITADRLLYRLKEAPSTPIMQLSLTPCSIIRGFEAKTSSNIVLKEHFNIIVDRPADSKLFVAIGLQHAPVPNLHHSTASSGFTSRGDMCDTKAVSLFSNVTVYTTVKVMRTVEPRRVPDFDEGLFAEAKKIKEAKKQEKGGDKELPEVDERSFFEKYWHYIIMFILWTTLQSFLKPPEPQNEEKKEKKD
eukprot:Tbor_TRINITY_DN6054_c1_g4::TRINITY_DN6054_c1_g4_i1::g.10864::m.10864